MRLFTAVGVQGLSFDPASAFKKLKVALDKKQIEHRWVPVENYHITLNFIGELEDILLPALNSLMQEVGERHHAFSLKVSDLKAFPDERSGRVIYAGVQNSRALRDLQEDLDQSLRALGLNLEEREYRPHLTIARLRSPRNLKDLLSPFSRQGFGDLQVNVISLYESKLNRGPFPVYHPVESVHLG